MMDLEYLTKKVEALETLYQAEKARAEEVQRCYAGLEKRLDDFQDKVRQLASWLRQAPQYW